MSSAAFSFEFDQFALAHQQETTTQRKPQVYPFDLFQPTQDIIAATPDSFDFDLDLSLSTEDSSALQLLSVDPNPAFHFVRPETAKPGPLSTFTVSSESAYESLSSQSESLYRSSYSQASYAASDFSFPLDMDFDRIRLDTMSEYGSSYGGSAYNVPQPAAVDLDAAVGFGLPPSPPYSPDSPKPRQESFSDYESPFTANPAASPNMSISPSASLTPELEDKDTDPRKKYKCNVCPRAFARAFNLKTHMATHDPNRLKPHVCPHPSCGRSFSRKHDLGRHLISIHREDQNGKKAIGTQKGNRVWCDQCGKSAQDKLDCECDKEV